MPFMPYDKLTRRTMLRSRPLAGRCRSLRNSAGPLSGGVTLALETGPGTTHALQSQIAVGAGWIHRVDDHCVRHTHARVASGNASRRPGCDGIGLLYRKLLDGTHYRRRVLFFPRGLAPGKAVCSWSFSSDVPVR